MISSGVRTVTTHPDFFCAVCGQDQTGVLVEDPEVEAASFTCGVCGTEHDIEWDTTDPDKDRD